MAKIDTIRQFGYMTEIVDESRAKFKSDGIDKAMAKLMKARIKPLKPWPKNKK